ncbi:DUF4129 domain-containing protein [Evansella sp. AB-rgal1]|uniref:DUF4129 domain-containing protein n=1 Tax=Evansella sp. AB-rgal1 TaxID=3242696 RepID=UPI00359D73CD
MTRIQMELIRWGHFGQEMFLLYIFLLAFYATDNVFLPVMPFILFVVIGTALYSFMVFLTKSAKLSALTIPLVLIVGLGFDFHFLLAAFIAIVLFWRVLSHIQEYDKTSELTVFFLTVTFGILYYFWFIHFEGRQVLLFFIFVQLSISLLLKTLSTIFQSTVNKDEKKNHLKWVLTGIPAITGVSFLIGFLYPYLRQLLYLLIQFFFIVLGLIAAPFLYLIQYLMSFFPENVTEEEEGMMIEDNGIFQQNVSRDTSIVDAITDEVIWGIMIIVLLFGLIIILKKYGKLLISKGEKVKTGDEAIKVSNRKSSFSIRNILTPNHEVRRLFYDLETKLGKWGYGRKEDQTVEAWLATLPIDSSVKQDITSTYHKVRYGEYEIDREERNKYKRAVRTVKKLLKDEAGT